MGKKKRNQDFQKIKLKAGKRLPKHLNETRPEFKAKRIQINPTIEPLDPVKFLSNISINTNRKLLYLNKLNEKYSSENPALLSSLLHDGEQIQIVCKYLTDPDHRVRAEVRKFLKVYFRELQNIQQSEHNQQSSPTLAIVLSFINCGITHINEFIRRDSEKLLCVVIDQTSNNEDLDEAIMKLFMTKINASQFGSLDDIYYFLLKQFIISICKRERDELQINNDNDQKENQTNSLNDAIKSAYYQELIWDRNKYNFLDLNKHQTLDRLFSCQESSLNLTFPNLQQQNVSSSSNIKKIFIEKIKTMLAKDLQLLIGFGESDKIITVEEADKLKDVLKIILTFDSVSSESNHFPSVQYFRDRLQPIKSLSFVQNLTIRRNPQQRKIPKKNRIFKTKDRNRNTEEIHLRDLLKKFYSKF